MKKIFIRISEKIYPEGVPPARGYDDKNYKPILKGMIEILFEPASIDERTHLMSIGCVGKISGTKTFSFSGICEQSQIGDIFIPSASLAFSIANMMKSYFEHFKQPYSDPKIDTLTKRILDDITNNVPVKSIFMDAKVQNPPIYRQMATEYRSRHGYNIENMIEEIVKEQGNYTFSSMLGTIKHAELENTVDYKGIISDIVRIKMERQAAIAPDPAKGAKPTAIPAKQNLVDQFPQFQPAQYVTMNFDRKDLLGKGFQPDILDKNQKYTTDQLSKHGMTFRDKVFYVVKKLPNGFYTVAGLDDNEKVININVWGAFLKENKNANKTKSLNALNPNQRNRFVNNLGIQGEDARKKADEIMEAAESVGLDLFPFTAYYKDAIAKKAMKTFDQYEAEAKNPGTLKKLWERIKNPSHQGLVEDVRNKMNESGETSDARRQLRLEQELLDYTRKIFTDAFIEYAKKYSINSAVRAKQLNMKVDDYKKKLELAGKNGMSVEEYMKQAPDLEKSDQAIGGYIDDPYKILTNLDAVKQMLAKDPGAKGHKELQTAYDAMAKDENSRIQAFLKHFGIPEDFLTNRQLSIENFDKVQESIEKLESDSKNKDIIDQLMPKLEEYLNEIGPEHEAYGILKQQGVDPNIFNSDPEVSSSAIEANKGKLQALRQAFQGAGLTDQVAKLDEIIKKSSKQVNPNAGGAGYGNIAPKAPQAGQAPVAPQAAGTTPPPVPPAA